MAAHVGQGIWSKSACGSSEVRVAGKSMEGRQSLNLLASLIALTAIFAWQLNAPRGWEEIARERPAGPLTMLRSEVLAARLARTTELLAKTDISAKVMQATTNGGLRTPELPSLSNAAPEPAALTPVATVAEVQPQPIAAPPEVEIDYQPLVFDQARGAWQQTASGSPGNLAPSRSAQPSAMRPAAVAQPTLSEPSPSSSVSRLVEQWQVAENPAALKDTPSAWRVKPLVRIVDQPLALQPQVPQPAVAGLSLAPPQPLTARRPSEVELPFRENLNIPTPETFAAPTPAHPTFVWQMPVTLLEELDRLSTERQCGEWTHRVASMVRSLTSGRRMTLAESKQILDDLHHEIEVGQHLSVETDREACGYAFRMTLYSLWRRLEVWDTVQKWLADTQGLAHVPGSNPGRLNDCLRQVEVALSADPAGEGWRQYLMLDALASVSEAGPTRLNLPQSSALARLVLERLEAPALSADQRHFVQNSPLTSLGDEMRRWSSEPVSLNQLLFLMESYERSGEQQYAVGLATLTQRLADSAQPEAVQLSQRLESHYRNHNLRISMSPALVNRFLPQPSPKASTVNDTVLGVPVRGHQTTVSRLGVQFVPNDSQICVGLALSGEVAAETYAQRGPAKLFTDSSSSYSAWKPVVISPQGVTYHPSQVEVNTVSQLQDLETDYDNVPLVGALVRAYAQNQHEEKRPQAVRETDFKVAQRVGTELDSTLNKALAEVKKRYDQRIGQPLETLDLAHPLMEMKTTQEELTLRGRLAAAQQLGSHMPRPLVPPNSLASVQLHESALNNILDQIGLAGGEFTPQDVQDLLVKKFNLPTDSLPRIIGRQVKFKFAALEPVRVRCREGRFEVTLRLDEVENGLQYCENVIVQVTYTPVVSRDGLQFQRDGNVSLEGDGSRGRTSIAMRAVFNKMFPKERPWELIPASTLADPRLAGVSISHFLLRDGWLSLSLSPTPLASRAPN